MLADMQYYHACDMYKSSRDADSSGRKLSGIGSRLAQCKDCSEAVELHSRRWVTKRCPNEMCTKLNDIDLTWLREGSV
jgi:hypothetical protein